MDGPYAVVGKRTKNSTYEIYTVDTDNKSKAGYLGNLSLQEFRDILLEASKMLFEAADVAGLPKDQLLNVTKSVDALNALKIY